MLRVKFPRESRRTGVEKRATGAVCLHVINAKNLVKGPRRVNTVIKHRTFRISQPRLRRYAVSSCRPSATFARLFATRINNPLLRSAALNIHRGKMVAYNHGRILRALSRAAQRVELPRLHSASDILSETRLRCVRERIVLRVLFFLIFLWAATHTHCNL